MVLAPLLARSPAMVVLPPSFAYCTDAQPDLLYHARILQVGLTEMPQSVDLDRLCYDLTECLQSQSLPRSYESYAAISTSQLRRACSSHAWIGQSALPTHPSLAESQSKYFSISCICAVKLDVNLQSLSNEGCRSKLT